MLAQSYLIFAPAAPTDIAAAAATQRQSIPLVWAFAFSGQNSTLHTRGGVYYFQTTVGDALAMLDMGMAAWNYNSYFRDTLAPVGVVRTWFANHPSETKLYLNISELVKASPTPDNDIAELKKLGFKVRKAIGEIEQKHFTTFLQELRKLSYPLVTVPITGDRKVDAEILTFEIRDTGSVEAEMALQMVGIDRDKTILNRATESIKLVKGKKDAGVPALIGADAHRKVLTLFTTDLDEARELLADELGCTVLRKGQHRLLLKAHGKEFMLVKIDEHK